MKNYSIDFKREYLKAALANDKAALKGFRPALAVIQDVDGTITRMDNGKVISPTVLSKLRKRYHLIVLQLVEQSESDY